MYSKKSFFANEQFVETIFKLISSEDIGMSLFKKVANTLKKMLGTSDWSKLMVNVRFERAVKPDAIPAKEMQFVHHIIDYLYRNKDTYTNVIMQEPIDEDDE